MIRFIASLLACVAITGCATVNPMAFDKNTTKIDTKDKSVILMTIDVSRSDDSRYVPKPFVVKFAKPNATTKEERQNFKMDTDTDTLQENGHTVYLARIALVAGEYKLFDVTGMASAFPFNSLFVVPLNMDVNLAPNSVVYAGRVTAKLRDRKGDEFRAGPMVPLIDQAVTGMSGGTWDVSVDNMAEKDVAYFRTSFPALKDVTIDTKPLPAFDRAAAQRLWEGEAPEPKKATEPAKAPAQVAVK